MFCGAAPEQITVVGTRAPGPAPTRRRTMLQQAAQPSQASLVDVQIRPSPDQVRPNKSPLRFERHFVPLADFLMLVPQGTHKRPPFTSLFGAETTFGHSHSTDAL
jgi:hypothetical protein